MKSGGQEIDQGKISHRRSKLRNKMRHGDAPSGLVLFGEWKSYEHTEMKSRGGGRIMRRG